MELENLNLPVKISDIINAGLSSIGIVLPLFITQFFAFLLCIAGLVYGIRLLRKEGAGLVPLLVTIGFGLFAAGIVFSWGESRLYPLSGKVTGQVAITDESSGIEFNDLKVMLLDFHNDVVSREAGFVDSRNGFFALTYDSVFGDYPRTVRITAPECVPRDYPLTRKKLHKSSSLHLDFTCQGEK